MKQKWRRVHLGCLRPTNSARFEEFPLFQIQPCLSRLHFCIHLPSCKSMSCLGAQHVITADYFGGRELFYSHLWDNGLFNTQCPKCHKRTTKLMFCKEEFPRTYCTTCSRQVPSCNNGSFFQKESIKNIPLFFFVLECFILNVSVEATTVLSGGDEKTVRKYLKVIHDVVNKSVKSQNRQMEGRLGGPGKIFENDEMIMTRRKNER